MNARNLKKKEKNVVHLSITTQLMYTLYKNTQTHNQFLQPHLYNEWCDIWILDRDTLIEFFGKTPATLVDRCLNTTILIVGLVCSRVRYAPNIDIF